MKPAGRAASNQFYRLPIATSAFLQNVDIFNPLVRVKRQLDDNGVDFGHPFSSQISCPNNDERSATTFGNVIERPLMTSFAANQAISNSDSQTMNDKQGESSHHNSASRSQIETYYKTTHVLEAGQSPWIRISLPLVDPEPSISNKKHQGTKKNSKNHATTNIISSENKTLSRSVCNAGESDSSSQIIPSIEDPVSSAIPESVLQYERQLRKIQAADRASKTLTIEDHLHTVYVDKHVVVTNKPSGVLCVPGVNKNMSLLDLVFRAYGDGEEVKGSGENSVTDSCLAPEGQQATIPQKQNLSYDMEKNSGNSKIDNKQNTPEKTHSRSKSKSHELDPLPKLPRDSMIVHRLDMDTSGIVIFARTRLAMSKLHKSFRERSGTTKVYEALLVGWLDINAWISSVNSGGDNEPELQSKESNDQMTGHNLGGGEIDLPLQRDHRHPPFMRVSTPESESEARQAVRDLNSAGWKKLVAKRPKPSTTRFRILSHEKWLGLHPVTRVELTPVTGRTHQLRVHCAAIGHPILGDPAYGFCGEAHPNGGFSDEGVRSMSPSCASFELRQAVEISVRENNRTMCLHARKLCFEHPETSERVAFEAPPSF